MAAEGRSPRFSSDGIPTPEGSHMTSIRYVLLSMLALGCGPISAPDGAVDLTVRPQALQTAFDGELGVPRLILLLSPA